MVAVNRWCASAVGHHSATSWRWMWIAFPIRERFESTQSGVREPPLEAAPRPVVDLRDDQGLKQGPSQENVFSWTM